MAGDLHKCPNQGSIAGKATQAPQSDGGWVPGHQEQRHTVDAAARGTGEAMAYRLEDC